MHSERAPLPEFVAQRTYDRFLIKAIMGELWDTVAEDDQSLDHYYPDVNSECWLNVGDMGVYRLHPENSATLIMHAQVLPEYRKFSELMGGAVWRWVLDECPPRYQKFTCSIPFIYPNVRAYVKRMGFTDEGVNRSSYRKEEHLVNQWLLGITRDEIERFMA